MYRGFYRHLASGNVYYVEGVARHANSATKLSVVYRQEYDSKLREDGTPLQIGAMWIRDLEDFNSKFEKLEKK